MLELDVTLAVSKRQDVHRRARFVVTGLVFFVLEPPHSRSSGAPFWELAGERIDVNDSPVDAESRKRVGLPEAPPGEPRVRVREAWAFHGEEKRALTLTPLARLERDRDGHAVLHLKASGRRADMDARGVAGGPTALEAVFEVTFEGPTTGR